MLSKPSSICWRSIFNSSLVLGFVGAGGIGFELLTAMNLFQYRTVSLLPLVTFRVSDRGRTAFGRAPTLDRLIGNLTEAWSIALREAHRPAETAIRTPANAVEARKIRGWQCYFQSMSKNCERFIKHTVFHGVLRRVVWKAP